MVTLGLLCAVSQAEAVASAQQGSIRVAILHATSPDLQELALRVDAALLNDLSALAGIHSPTVSPIEYEEIKLTVGCQDESRSCLSSIATMVQVDAVVVRTLRASGTDTISLSLLYHDASSTDEPRHVELVGEGADADETVLEGVPSLVRGLFGIPETVEAAPSDQAPSGAPDDGRAPVGSGPKASDSGDGIGTFTWVSLGAGTALLASGLFVGLSAQDAFDEYKDTPVETNEDAERADSEYEDASARGTWASVLIPLGSLVLVAGGTLLVLDLLGSDEENPSETGHLGLRPVKGGGMVMFNGTWRGAP